MRSRPRADPTGAWPKGEPTRDEGKMDDRTNFFVGWGTLALINAGLEDSPVNGTSSTVFRPMSDS